MCLQWKQIKKRLYFKQRSNKKIIAYRLYNKFDLKLRIKIDFRNANHV